MRTRICRASGCEALTTRFGAYCNTHKTRNRRHGAPDQQGITKSDLKPYLTTVRERVAKNEGLAVWKQLEERWLALVEHAKEAGRTSMLAPVKRAAAEINKLATDVQPRAIIETVLAVYLMREEAPYRFKGDKAFNTQLVRRVRALSPRNATCSISATTGRRGRAYTELTPRITAVLSEWIIGAVGVAGVWIAKQEAEQRKAKDRERQTLAAGLQEIDFG